MQDYWVYKFRHVHEEVSSSDLADYNSTYNISTANTSFADAQSAPATQQTGLTPLQMQWNSHLSIASTVPQIIVLLINASFGHKVNMKMKLFTSLMGIVVLFMFTAIMTQVNTDHFQYGFLILTLATATLISCCIALLQVVHDCVFIMTNMNSNMARLFLLKILPNLYL